MLAITFLVTGEHYKAYDLFVKTCVSVQEEYIYNKTQQPFTEKSSPNVMYYLKVIHLFELHGARDYALQLADVALTDIANDEPLIVT